MKEVTQMTLNLPTDLLKTTEKIINSGIVENFDELVTLALEHEIVQIQKSQQNNQFLSKNNDHKDDPIWGLGENPINGGIKDASTNTDSYLYDC